MDKNRQDQNRDRDGKLGQPAQGGGDIQRGAQDGGGDIKRPQDAKDGAANDDKPETEPRPSE